MVDHERVFNPQWGKSMCVEKAFYEKMKKAGYEPVHTGGGCFAWQKVLNEREWLWITVDGTYLGDCDLELADREGVELYVPGVFFDVGRYLYDNETDEEGSTYLDVEGLDEALATAECMPKPVAGDHRFVTCDDELSPRAAG